MKYVDGLTPEVARMEKVKLPLKLEQLHQQFMELEKIAALKFGKSYVKLDYVQRMIAKNGDKSLPKFTSDTLARILHVYPDSYLVKLDPVNAVTTPKPAGKAIPLVYSVYPSLRNDLGKYYLDSDVLPSPTKCPQPSTLMSSPTKLISPVKGVRKQPNLDYIPKSPTKSPMKPVLRPAIPHAGQRFQPWRQKCRSLIFKYKLYQFVRCEHDKFVKELGVKCDSPDGFVPQFDANSIAPIPLADLPQLPKLVVQKTMADYLKSVPNNKESTPPPRPMGPRALLESFAASAPVKSPSTASPASSKSRQNLFQRILEKQQKNEAKEAARDHEAERRMTLLEQLEGRVLPVLQSEYAKHESREVGPLFRRLKISLTSLRLAEFKEMAALLADLTPDNFRLITEAGRQYLRIVHRDFDHVAAAVRSELKLTRRKVEAGGK